MLSSQNERPVSEFVARKLRHAGAIEIVSHGYSMYPFIKPGDNCRFECVSTSGLQPGDVVLYASDEGKLVGHRLLTKEWAGSEELLILKGDSNRERDPMISMNDALGRLSHIHREHRLIPMNTRTRRVWTWGVLNIRAISVLSGKLVQQRLTWKHRLTRLVATSKE